MRTSTNLAAARVAGRPVDNPDYWQATEEVAGNNVAQDIPDHEVPVWLGKLGSIGPM
jgi:hypothetical protein